MGSSKQASDFETIYTFLFNYIKRTYDRGNDIAEALRKMEVPDTKLWKPSLQVSLSSDADEEKRENRQYELDYKAEFDEFMKRKRAFEENSYKAYAEIWARCNKAMQGKIESRKDYDSEIYNKPIKLIEAIKEHALNYEESRYEMSIILDAFKAFINCRQNEKEGLQDYTRRFKVAREILNSHLGGGIILQKFVETMSGYDPSDGDKVKELVKKVDEQLASFVYLVNSDQTKYGSVIKGLHSQKALGNDQYPRTVVESNSVLSTHRYDNSREFPPKKNEKKEKEKETTDKDEGPTLSFAQLEGKCYCCGKAGHRSPDCYKKSKIPREEWAINKTQIANVVQEGESKEEVQEKSTEKHIGWAGVHCMFTQDNKVENFEQDLKKLILLDSDSNATIFL